MVLIKLTSDNFENELLTVEAYEEVVLQMSTGDHACHKYEILIMPSSDIRVLSAKANSDAIFDESFDNYNRGV